MSDKPFSWILALPPLFLLHEAEEYRSMLPWLSEHPSLVPASVRAIIPDSPAFIAYGGILFLVIYAVSGVIAIRSRPLTAAWFVFGVLLAARMENAVLHCIESIGLMMYTPGVVTAALLVLPLTVYLLVTLVKLGFLRRSWMPALFVVGLVVQSAGIAAMLLIPRI